MAALAGRQWGVVTRAQLLDAGFSEPAITRMLARGELVALHRGVYAVGHAVLRVEGFWLAAVHAGGPGSALSHRSAAELWGLGHVRGRVIDVTCPGVRRRRPGLVAHRHRLARQDVTVHRGIPVTTVSRTILDLAELLSRDDLHRTIEQAIRLRRYDRAALDATVARAHGRHALKPLRAALDELDPVRARTKSELERRILPALAAAGLPAPRVNERVAGHEVDLHWPAQRVVVELDSRTWHTDPRAFEQDRIRDGDLLAAGWRVLRVTWRRLRDDPAWVVARIADLLA